MRGLARRRSEMEEASVGWGKGAGGGPRDLGTEARVRAGGEFASENFSAR